MVHFRSLTLGFALLSYFQSASAAEELTPERFKELTTSGKNGMIKFYQVRSGPPRRRSAKQEPLRALTETS